MLLPCPPYCTQQTGPLTPGLTLREIPPRTPKSREHPWVAAFLKALAREDVASVTVRGYRSDLGQFAAWYHGHPLEKLTASDLAHFRQYLSRERSMKPASVNPKLEALRRFCRWAHTSGKLRSNVSAELKLARAVRGTRPKGLLADEVQALLRVAGQSRRALARPNYAIVQLLLQAGLWVSEAAALRIEDLDIHARRTIRRWRSIERSTNPLSVPRSKTAASSSAWKITGFGMNCAAVTPGCAGTCRPSLSCLFRPSAVRSRCWRPTASSS